MPTALDRLTVANRTIVDSSGRSVVLRGFVTITADHRGPVELGEEHFDQIAGWGFNAQQIRLEAGRLGVLECEFDPAYLDKLERWVDLAAARGIYSIFKMTTYDVPSIGGAGGAFNRDTWQQFWERNEWRENRIEAWTHVWERFRGRREVVGYDILNEPIVGTDTPNISHDHLYPFYEEAGRALRKIDDEALLIVQPITGGALLGEVLEGDTPHGNQPALSDPLNVFAPHFYPDILSEISADDYDRYMAGLVEEAEQVGGPILIGEYELPTIALMERLRAWNPRDARLKGEVFDRYGIGCIRPWYIDEGWWSVLDSGFVETDRLNAVVRPYPHRVGGRATWSFDYDSRELRVDIDVDPNVRTSTIIAVQEERFYPGGVAVEIDGEPSPFAAKDDRLEIPSDVLGRGRKEIVVRPA